MKQIRLANYRPIVISAILLALGILIGALASKVLVAFIVILLVLSIGTIGAFFLKFLSVKIGAIFLLIGFLSMSITSFTAHTDTIKFDDIYYEGRVKEVSRSGSTSNRYVLENVVLLGENIEGRVLLNANGQYEIGDLVGVYGSFENIPFEPFDSYSVSKHREKIYYTSVADESLKIGDSSRTLIERLRIKIRNLYYSCMGEEEGAIALGLVLGDTSSIDYDTSEDMRASGLSHLFSVSGLHVGFMSTIIFYLFRLLKVAKKKSIIWVTLILLTYGILTGFPVGVVRASVMSLLVLIAEIKHYRYDQLNGLAFAVIILLLINPLDLFSVSFLLSVAAMFGIACFYKRIISIYQGDSLIVKRLLGSVSVSLSANVFVLPVSAYYFGTISVYFLLANLIVVPIASAVYFLIVPLTLFSLIIPYLGVLIAPLGMPILAISTISSGIGNIPFATLNLYMPLLAGLIYSFGFVILSRYYMGSKRSKIIISALSFITCALIILIN